MEAGVIMHLTVAEQIERALSQEAPVESIRQLVVALNKGGLKKEEILREFCEFDNTLKNASRDNDVDVLEDVIDMMTGYYVGRNLDLE